MGDHCLRPLSASDPKRTTRVTLPTAHFAAMPAQTVWLLTAALDILKVGESRELYFESY